ncbi:helix-turn-helix transcriptional regulator SCDLUD_001336 [Saccharomycodes ludwigii]|uniref:helix-turn-helix transcriptional regulator n=1 Tax=Saccharomycodes ludwigii TaxID=36035 RepID=UPI001E845BD6|nr:hypothetical protein SCDLUD_001336 [Saccharomycodes ludwigii]KAH3901573.1 hypothetical protein SCDLUD_001336 [Saccharomycodes ludwigii]
MDASVNEESVQTAISGFIVNLCLLINHSINFSPELIKRDEQFDQSKRQYLLPMLVSDPLKLSGGCLPKFVIQSYKQTLNKLDIEIDDTNNYHYLNNDYTKKFYMNRTLSMLEYNRLNKVVEICFYNLYMCVLRFKEVEQYNKDKYLSISKLFNTSFTTTEVLSNSSVVNFKTKNWSTNNTWKEIFQEHLFLTENRFSRIFKSFVGITFKEYETFCFKTLEVNFRVLKDCIDIVSSVGNEIDHNIWKNLAYKLLNNINCDNRKNSSVCMTTNSGNVTIAKNAWNIFPINPEFLEAVKFTNSNIDAADTCKILLPQSFSLQNYSSSNGRENRKNTKVRKQLLAKKIPKLEPGLVKKCNYYLLGLVNTKSVDGIKSEHMQTLNPSLEPCYPEHCNSNKSLATVYTSKNSVDSCTENQSVHLFKIPNSGMNNDNDGKLKELLISEKHMSDNYTTANFVLPNETLLANGIYTKDATSNATKIDTNYHKSDDNITTILNNNNQKQHNSSFQAAYKAFCLDYTMEALYLYHYDTTYNHTNYKKTTPSAKRHNLIDRTEAPLTVTPDNEPDSAFSENKTSSDIIREMLFYEEKQEQNN